MTTGMLEKCWAGLISFFLCILIAKISASSEREMTVKVESGQEECFFEHLNSGDTLDIDYQVIDGGRQNEMEINFKVSKPNGIPLIADYRKPDHTHRTTVDESGDYKICFDNTYSRFSPKIVFFEIIVESEGDDDSEDGFGELFNGVPETDQYEIQVQDIEGALRVIKEKVASAKRFQDQIRNHEFRDRSIAEHNFERVNFWSILQLIIMIIAGFAQVMLVRSLFDEKSYLYKLWKRIC